MPTIATLPLIPLPDDASPSPNLDPSDPLNDLFGGISPPAPARPRRALTPPPLSATGSEFGDFVSVSASEDPLALTSPVPVQRPIQQSIGERVGISKDLLDELLKHEDDPMYFHRLGAATPQPPPPRGSSPQNPPNLPKPPLTPFPSERPQHKRQASASVRAHIQRLADTPYDLSRDLSEASLTPLDTPPISAQTLSDSSISDAPREREKSHERASPPAIRRRASLSPSSPTRPSLPELSHTESQSSFIPTAATRWMDTLLSFAPPASSRQPHSEHAGTLPVPKHSTTMPIPGRAATIGRTSGFPETHTSLTHGTPFAPHAFVPATGAPGFAGDRSWDRGFEFDPDGKREGGKRSILLNGRNSMTVVILDIELADHLRPYLPALARLSTSWRLLFSLDQHGISLQTLYTRCALHKGGVVFAAKDGQGGVFGSWLGEGIHAGRGESFFGSGESFLWRAKGDAAGVDVFKWTGKNDYVALCEKDYIAFGGGDGTYGLYLDESLFDGSSAPCPTFENDVLCRPSGHRRGRTEGFQCVGVEVWGVGNP